MSTAFEGRKLRQIVPEAQLIEWYVYKRNQSLPGSWITQVFKMATDIIFHRFWVDLDSILGCFLVKIRKNGYKKAQQKHACKKVTKVIPRDPAKSRNGSCGPFKTIQGSQIPGLGA